MRKFYVVMDVGIPVYGPPKRHWRLVDSALSVEAQMKPYLTRGAALRGYVLHRQMVAIYGEPADA